MAIFGQIAKAFFGRIAKALLDIFDRIEEDLQETIPRYFEPVIVISEGIYAFLAGVDTKRTKRARLTALVVKEELTKQALIDLFNDKEETFEAVEKAFKTGESAWPSHLTAMFGKRKANQLLAAMSENILERT